MESENSPSGFGGSKNFKIEKRDREKTWRTIFKSFSVPLTEEKKKEYDRDTEKKRK